MCHFSDEFTCYARRCPTVRLCPNRKASDALYDSMCACDEEFRDDDDDVVVVVVVGCKK